MIQHLTRAIALFAIVIAAGAAAPLPPSPFGSPQYDWAHPPSGPWGLSAAIERGPHDEIWAISRCGAANCEGSNRPPIIQLDLKTGRAIRAIGAGLFATPHGLHIDRDGNLWVADTAVSKDGKRGEQVTKLSPDGKVLMRLGTAGVAGGGPARFHDPSDIAIAPNGDIFVADGHGALDPKLPPDTVTRIIKFSPQGKFIKAWGSLGSGPRQFRNVHGLAFDSQGRLFAADRGNARFQIFDQDGKLLDQWHQFGAPSGLYIGKDDALYAVDYNTPGRTGIWIGSARTGKVTGFVPDPTAGEGVILGPDGNLYTAVSAGKVGITRYLKH